MKDLSIYFTPDSDGHHYNDQQLGGVVEINSVANGFPEISENGVALIYVPEYRQGQTKGNSDAWIPLFRAAFLKQYLGNWSSNIYDLGTIIPGAEVMDTYMALVEVVSELSKKNIVPLVIGGSQDLTFPIYKAYEKLEQTVNLVAVDASLDMGDPDEDIHADGWLNKIILHKPNYLFNFSLFGYQSNLVSRDEMKLLNDLYFDQYRLGEFYSNERMAEPLVRNADILSFDLNAIKSADYKGNLAYLPNGFYGEDACRIMRYAGISDKLSALGLFNYSEATLESDQRSDINLLAQMCWYFIEGYNLRKQDYPVGSKSAYLKYRVNIDDFKDEIVFYKSNKSSRWWMEVPYPNVKGVKLQRHLLVPCNYEDYENALDNELPDLWLRTYRKLS
jgi:arginase family enzyme